MVEVRGIVCIFAMAKIIVSLGRALASNHPRDGCIYFFDSPSHQYRTNTKSHPIGWLLVLVEVRGIDLHHLFPKRKR